MSKHELISCRLVPKYMLANLHNMQKKTWFKMMMINRLRAIIKKIV